LFLVKPLSLALRLSVSVTAGHIVTDVISSFAKSLSLNFIVGCVLVFIFLLEFMIICLQSYIFVSLSCMYLSDMINCDH